MKEGGNGDLTKKAIITAIQKISNTHNIDVVEIINCTVDSVDKTARTCDVTPLSGKSTTPIKGVGLMVEKNDGEMKVPSIGSTVGVAMSTQVDPYIVTWSDLDQWYLVIGKCVIDVLGYKITVGDGTFGGLVEVAELTVKLNQLVTQMQAQLVLIATGIASAGGSYSPGTLSQFTKTDYENQEIKHGITH